MENGGGTKRRCWGQAQGGWGPRAGKAGSGHSEEQMAHLLFGVTLLLPLWSLGLKETACRARKPSQARYYKGREKKTSLRPHKRKSLSTTKKHQ